MSQWYLIAYDVRDPRRLQRLHRYLSRRATAVQHSVFIFNEREKRIDELIEGMCEYISDQYDDLRLYPIYSPGDLWLGGSQMHSFDGIYPINRDKTGFLKKMAKLITQRKTKR